MKPILFITALFFSISAYGDDFDTYTRNAGYALIAIDWAQTIQISRDDNFIETNQGLGEYPTVAEVNRFFIVRTLYHFAINKYKPFDLHKMWNVWVIMDGGSAVINNHMIGVRFGFNLKF